MKEYTYPANSATQFDRFLSSLVAEAVDELATPLDRFLSGLVSDAADALAIDDAATARTTAPVYHVNPAIHGFDGEMLGLIASQLNALPLLAGPIYLVRGSDTPSTEASKRDHAQITEERLHLAVARLEWEVSL